MATPRFELCIISPPSGQISSSKAVTVEIRVMKSGKRAEFSELHPWLGRHPVYVIIDGKHRYKSTRVLGKIKGRLVTYLAKISIARFAEGTHELCAEMQLKWEGRKPGQVIVSEPVEFTSDWSAPKITRIFPADGMNIEAGSLRQVFAEATDPGQGLDLLNCRAAVNGRPIGPAVISGDRIVFGTGQTYAAGVHTLSITMCDNGGNKTESETTFNIIEPAPAVSPEQIEQIKLHNRERLQWDPEIKRKLIENPAAAFAELNVPFTSSIGNLLPPALPGTQAAFFATTDPVRGAEVIGGLTQKIDAALASRDNERIAEVLQRLNITSTRNTDGSLTPNAIASISKIFEDPLGIMADIGVEPTEEERLFLFPAFPKEHAAAMAEWVSTVLCELPPAGDPERAKKLTAFRQQIASDEELRFSWLTRPKETWLQFFPAATARELLELPAPITAGEARKIIDGPTVTQTPSSGSEPHNSCDLITEFSFPFINKVIHLFFSTIMPGILPVDVGPVTRTINVLGAPVEMSIRFFIDAPGNVRVADPATNALSLTGRGDCAVSIAQQVYTFVYSFSPVYTVSFDNEKVMLRFQRLDVRIGFTGFNGADEAGREAERMIIDHYPKNDIYIVDRKPVNINLPMADTAVIFHRIHVHDDLDSGGSGELFFGLGVDGSENLFGRYDANSGSVIELQHPGLENNLFRLGKGDSAISVSARGVDLDFGMWPDRDNYMGAVSRLNYRSAPGHYAITAQAEIEHFQMVWDVVEVALKVVCWVVDAVVWVLNKCGEWFGLPAIEWRCANVAENVMGWIRRRNTEIVNSFTLEYEIRALDPLPAAIRQAEVFLTDNALHLGFDLDIPGIPDRKSKSALSNFTGVRDFGFAFSENLLDKLISAWWKYSSVARRVSTSFDSRALYGHIDLYNPEIDIIPFQDSLIGYLFGFQSPYHLKLQFDMSGQCGLNLGPIHDPLGCPNHVVTYNSLELERTELSFRIKRFWLNGDNFATDVLNVIAMFYNAFGFLSSGISSKRFAFEIAPLLRQEILSAQYVFDPELSVGSRELKLSCSVAIEPTITCNATQLDFTNNDQRTLTIRNTGQAMLKISGILVDDPLFRFLDFPALPLSIMPGQKYDLTLELPHNWTGLHNAILQMNCNDPKHPQVNVSLLARDVPLIKVEPEQVLFNSYTDVHASVSINSVGHGVLTITGVSADTDSYRLTGFPAPPFTLLPQEHLLFDIETNPIGSFSGTITITSSDAGNPVVRIPVSTDRPLNIGSVSIGPGGGGY